jgi:hypothetical protein
MALARIRSSSRPKLRDAQKGFAGGLNTTGDAFELRANQLTRADNARLTQYGSATKRGGTQRIHSAALAGAVRGGFTWMRATSEEHLAVAGGSFYSAGDTYGIPMVYAAVAVSGGGAAITAGAQISFAAFRDGAGEVVYLADGGELLKYDGTTLERVAGTPNVARLTVYNQRLLAISGDSQTIYYSGLNDGDTLNDTGSGGGAAVVRTFGDQRLTTLLTLRASLAMLHVSGISRFAGITQDDIAIAAGAQGFSSDVGTPFPSSAIAIDGIGFFLTERGGYRIDDDGLAALDTPEQPDPTAPILAGLSTVDRARVAVVHDRTNREVRWTIPGVGVYCYNYRLGAWTGPWTGAYVVDDFGAQWEAVDADGKSLVLFGLGDGFVRRADAPGIYLDDVLSDGTGGDAFSMVLKMRRMFTEAPTHEKAFRWAWLFANIAGSEGATLAWSTLAGSGVYTISSESSAIWGGFTWGSFTWGGSGARAFRVPISGRGPYIDFTFTDAGEIASTVSRLELEAFDLGPRG